MTNRQNRKGRSKHGPPFVQLQKWMLDSEAWRGLSMAARAAYIELEKPYNGANNGSIGMSVRFLAERLRCSKNTAGRVLVELEDSGFIEATKVGKFSLRNRVASEYRLTIHRCDLSGHPPSKKFMATLPRYDQRDRAVRPQGQMKQNCRPRYDQRDRQASKGPIDGTTTGTHIESNHGGTAVLKPFPSEDQHLAPAGERASGPITLPSASPSLLASRLVRKAAH